MQFDIKQTQSHTLSLDGQEKWSGKARECRKEEGNERNKLKLSKYSFTSVELKLLKWKMTICVVIDEDTSLS